MMSAESMTGKKQTGSGRKINSLEDGRRRPQVKQEDCVKGLGGIGSGEGDSGSEDDWWKQQRNGISVGRGKQKVKP